MTRSGLFTAYNVARSYAHQGYIDQARLNRALGLAQAKEPRPYRTILGACSCPDKRLRRVPACKHELRLLLLELAS